MNLLEDARRLAKTNGQGYLHDSDGPFVGCAECGTATEDGHASDCPWLALPRIVAALEAAERVVDMQFAAWCVHADTINDLAGVLRGEKVDS